jgi:Zn-dependent protease
LRSGALAHEISHALVARRNDTHVEDITWWLFGGVAGCPETTATLALRIAGGGPLVRLLLGTLFLVVVRCCGCAEGRALLFSDGALIGIVSPSDVSRVLRRIGVPTDNR